jgi:HD-GYP domain-containing protein (c-di-GMP phosphodiesterase class II)
LLTEDEVVNLSIQRGTLNDDEREVVNNHIVATIKMLESLPFPKNLQNVPEYAGGHHEKMDGSGYPRGLRREDMSVQARIMAIADIFEALTASDRPYKKGKNLSECLKIMGFMKKDQHIDPDIFDIFIKHQVYLDYAEEFLEPEQIDEIDEALIPGYVS